MGKGRYRIAATPFGRLDTLLPDLRRPVSSFVASWRQLTETVTFTLQLQLLKDLHLHQQFESQLQLYLSDTEWDINSCLWNTCGHQLVAVSCTNEIVGGDQAPCIMWKSLSRYLYIIS